MKGIMFVEKGVAQIIDEPMPVLRENTMLLKTLYSGVSNGTERNFLMGGNYNGKGWPNRIGYQNVSQVIECGAGITKYKVGDIVYPGRSPGHVEYHLATETELLTKIPDGMDLKDAALLGVATVPFHDCRLVNLTVEDNVLITGAGLIGQFAAQAARVMGARVTVADIDTERVKLAKELGADFAFNNSTEDGREAVRNNGPYSVFLDCSGVQDVVDEVIGLKWGEGLLKNNARVVLVAGRFDARYNFNAASSHSISVYCTAHFNQVDLDNVVRLVSKGAIRITPLIKRCEPIDNAIEIYNILRDKPNELLGTVIKWVQEE